MIEGVSHLADAVREHGRPLSVAVIGRPGTGRKTMVRALRRQLSLDARVAAEHMPLSGPDLWCHVLSGPPRAADLELAGRLPADRTVVVLTKADVYGPVPDISAPVFAPGASATAARCARELGRPVTPVSALWAVAAPTGPQVALLGALADAGERVPEVAGRFTMPSGVAGPSGVTGPSEVAGPTGVSGPPGAGGGGRDDEERLRIGLLRTMDRWGVELAIRAATDGYSAAGQIEALLHTASGIRSLADVIAGRASAVAGARTRALAVAAERIAARGIERAAAETLLADLGRAG
ncbi:hypothetical protein M2359_000735 [Gordonia amarae]|nr:hypothetical protein [Gordonia amarae]MCS3877106.1 hypothetical protein [Gordonia amarae]